MLGRMLSRGRVVMISVAVGAAGLSPAAMAAQTPTPQTVMVGSTKVVVPSSGVINIEGTPVSVPHSFTGRMVLVQPPSGSNVISQSGNTERQLPAGATGASFSLLPQDTTAAVVPSTATYQPAGAPSGMASALTHRRGIRAQQATLADDCELYADPPYAAGGEKIDADSDIYCNTGHALIVNIISTLYWLGNSGWVWQSNAGNSGNQNEWIGATATHSCTFNTTHYWHTRADTTIEDFTTDIDYADYVNSGPVDPTCR